MSGGELLNATLLPIIFVKLNGLEVFRKKYLQPKDSQGMNRELACVIIKNENIYLTNEGLVSIIIKLSGCGEVWYRA